MMMEEESAIEEPGDENFPSDVLAEDVKSNMDNFEFCAKQSKLQSHKTRVICKQIAQVLQFNGVFKSMHEVETLVGKLLQGEEEVDSAPVMVDAQT